MMINNNEGCIKNVCIYPNPLPQVESRVQLSFALVANKIISPFLVEDFMDSGSFKFYTCHNVCSVYHLELKLQCIRYCQQQKITLMLFPEYFLWTSSIVVLVMYAYLYGSKHVE